MGATVGIGILGWGRLARRSLSRSLPLLQGGKWLAVGTHYPEGVKDIPEEIEVLNYQNLVDHPDIQAIHLATPNHLHLPWARKALEAGKHVLCEKPMGLGNSEELDQLQDLARDRGLLLAEAFMYRHHEQYDRLHSLLAANRIGTIRRMDILFSFFLQDRSDIRWQKDCAGGALADVGCYGLDLARWLLGAPAKIRGFSVMDETSGVDATSSWMMEHSGGVISRIHVSMEEGFHQRVLIQGSEGEIELPHAFIPAHGKRVNLLVRDKGGQEIIKCGPCHPFLEEWKVFLDSISSGHLMAPLENGQENAFNMKKTITNLETL